MNNTCIPKYVPIHISKCIYIALNLRNTNAVVIHANIRLHYIMHIRNYLPFKFSTSLLFHFSVVIIVVAYKALFANLKHTVFMYILCRP